MRKCLPLLILVGLFGCSDQNALEQAKLRDRFDAAVAEFDKAQTGYVPHEGRHDTDIKSADLQSYRKTTLSKAAKTLQGLVDVGPVSQQTAARRLLADADISNAMQDAQQATNAWATLTSESTRLLSLLTAVDRATARAAEFEADQSPALVDQLRENQAGANQRLAQLEQQAAQLQPKIDEHKRQIAQLQASSEAATGKSRSFYDKAFTSKGDEQARFYKESEAQQRQAEVADAQSRRLSVELDLASSEMAILAKQLELARDASKSAQEQVADAETRMAHAKTARESAQAQKWQAAEDLEKEFGRVAKVYSERVDAPFKSAQTQADDAVVVLAKGIQKATSVDRKALQSDLMSAHLTRAFILTQWVMAEASYARQLTILANQTQRLLPGRTVFAESARHGKESLDELIGKANAAIGEGVGLAAELAQSAAGDDAFIATVNDRRDRLNRYSGRITNIQTGNADKAPE